MKRTRLAVEPPLLFVLACLLPACLLTFYFIIWPAVQVLWLSFTKTSVLGMARSTFIGINNYISMFLDKRFIEAMQNTFLLLLVAPIITIFFALLLAFALTQGPMQERNRNFFRTIFFFPSIISMAVIGIVWSFIFHPNMGILNNVLTGLGFKSFEGFPWTADARTTIWTIAVAFIWQSAGYFMVMHIAAIDSISDSVYEAATIDGAGPVQKLFLITLPLIKDIIGITFIFALSGILDNSFAFSNIMTPRGKGDVLLTYIYTQGFVNAQYGYAMAITAFTLVIAITLSALSRFITDRQGR